MAIESAPSFDAPIPGMSLTHALGDRPWQSPAQYSTVDEAIQYYMDRMTTDDFMDQLMDILELGISVSDIANIIQTSSVMEGIHSVDVGVLVSPVIMEMIMFVADSAGVKYETGLDEPEEKPVSKAKIAKILNELETELEDKEEEQVTETIVEEEEPKGLMARRQ